jgi:hemolysin type calcium-binding protein
MLGAAITALALAHAAGACPAGPPSGIALIYNPVPLIAGRPTTLCLYPLPGPPGRSFEWDLGSDGTVDATTVEPQLAVAAAPPTVLKVTVRYTATVTPPSGTFTVPYAQDEAFPVQDPPPPPPPVRAATVRVENDTLIYRGSPDVSDHIYVSEQKPYRWEILGAAVEPGTGCTRESEPNALVACPLTRMVDVQLGDHGRNVFVPPDETVWRFTAAKVLGGVKSDRIAATGPAAATLADGGPGDDTVVSSGLALGGPGDDTVASPVRAVGGEGNDRFVGGHGRFDGGPGNDTAKVRGRNVTVLLGPGNDTFIGYGFRVRVYGGTGNDLFRVPLACTCGLFGEAGNDTFHTVTSLIGGPGPERSQFVLGGPGRDTALLDGSDCAKGVERITRTRLTGSDSRYRCKPPSANLTP